VVLHNNNFLNNTAYSRLDTNSLTKISAFLTFQHISHFAVLRSPQFCHSRYDLSARMSFVRVWYSRHTSSMSHSSSQFYRFYWVPVRLSRHLCFLWSFYVWCNLLGELKRMKLVDFNDFTVLTFLTDFQNVPFLFSCIPMCPVSTMLSDA
jgi:hypothetical protein